MPAAALISNNFITSSRLQACAREKCESFASHKTIMCNWIQYRGAQQRLQLPPLRPQRAHVSMIYLSNCMSVCRARCCAIKSVWLLHTIECQSLIPKREQVACEGGCSFHYTQREQRIATHRRRHRCSLRRGSRRHLERPWCGSLAAHSLCVHLTLFTDELHAN
jgi:hypothetical protein